MTRTSPPRVASALAGRPPAPRGAGAAQESQLRPHLPTPGLLRVCADPDNMPLSNQKGEGFEQKIAELIAKEWDAKMEYAWWPVRRGFFSRALNGRYCDVAIEAPAGLDMAGVTEPVLPLRLRLRHPEGQRARHHLAGRSAPQEAQDRRQPAPLRCREHAARHGAEPLRGGRESHRVQHLLHRRRPPRGHRQRGRQEGRGHRDRVGTARRLLRPKAARCRSTSGRCPSGTRSATSPSGSTSRWACAGGTARCATA